jgi:hypothetical protein
VWRRNLGRSTAAIAGDYNTDGAVDAADYAVWRKTLGSTSDLRADGNGNGSVDPADLTVWKAHFGESGSRGAGDAAFAAAAFDSVHAASAAPPEDVESAARSVAGGGVEVSASRTRREAKTAGLGPKKSENSPVGTNVTNLSLLQLIKTGNERRYGDAVGGDLGATGFDEQPVDLLLETYDRALESVDRWSFPAANLKRR